MLAQTLFRNAMTQVRHGGFRVRWWDGTEETYGEGEPGFVLSIKEPSVLHEIARDTENGFADAYIAGRIDVEGDLADVVSLAIRNSGLAGSGALGRLPASARSVLRRLSRRRQRENVQSHYDLGNDFFCLWLDESMTYSCALFESPEDSLEDAQRRKLDYSLGKLRIAPGDTLLDIGCGWGSAIMRAAANFGARATGITLSRQQADWARDRIRGLGLERLCEVREVNYLDLVRDTPPFDRILSIGMVEHVGRAFLGDFARSVRSLLKPGGRALIHTITRPAGSQPVDDRAFSTRIFPGGYLPTVREMCDAFDDAGLTLQHAENIGPNYALTLDAWSARFEANVERVRAMFGEEFARLWRLYLRGFSALFRERTLDVHQLLFSNGPLRDEQRAAGERQALVGEMVTTSAR
jgi:cyclopropane-fatty-acyl-phospholipid synthase